MYPQLSDMYGTSVMKCVWPLLTTGSKCFHCGYALKRDYHKPPVRECKADFTYEEAKRLLRTDLGERPGLGDRIEAALTAVGITQETYKAIKSEFGLPPTCNCDARIAYLNKVGEKYGRVVKLAIAALFPKPAETYRLEGGKATRLDTNPENSVE